MLNHQTSNNNSKSIISNNETLSIKTHKASPNNEIPNLDRTLKQEIEKSFNFKKISISLDWETLEVLEVLANHQNISVSEAIKKAIATEVYLLKEREAGAKVLLHQKDKTWHEIIFK